MNSGRKIFKTIGFDGNDDKLVSELCAMIDMAKTMYLTIGLISI